ncbi:hypothetical protein EV198_1687 [Roseivirga ehrenbergii]|uniref:HMA domain-containing protein n=1 Tax=Roseivirga ehrenbergii (strain DSM 102268 / JCM 13514 / KCTC 12282 / NCIMB 14502 / KMM 6017) TaxID=279360 RepID=A0A150XRY1_ROSEK|nr:hypothetical protein [Roseivirga ehrenbergii]KYG81500.1 hypothetical protein MB14_12980 [Roseivirga ehrenbergii]TCL10655.1 hypothetical protein EV198_1687 [Roseivirga ehrenbergii]
MVHIFKTSVASKKEVRQVGSFLNILLPSEEWNFDLEDCDKILRVETEEVAPETVITILTSQGFYCDELAG